MKIRHIASGCAALAMLATGLRCQDRKHQPPDAETPPTRPTIHFQQLVTGLPNDWFDRTRLFMGESLNEEKVTGKFEFKNPTGKKQTWENLIGSCQCARVVIKIGQRIYELSKTPIANSLHRVQVEDGKTVKERVTHIDIGPGDKGEVVVHMEMGGWQGYRDATLAISTTDPKLPRTTLTWQAKGVKPFDITPDNVFLKAMKWSEKREFSFVVASSVNPDFKLLDHDPLPDYVKIEKKQFKLPNGKTAWKVEGTFGPNADPMSGGIGIRFETDWKDREVRLTVIATIVSPVSIEPGRFLSFGKIRKGKGAERTITFVPNDGFDLALEKVEFSQLTIDRKYISAVAAKDGKKLIVTVKIAPEVQGIFLIRGSMLLQLNHPALQGTKFNFNGILR